MNWKPIKTVTYRGYRLTESRSAASRNTHPIVHCRWMITRINAYDVEELIEYAVNEQQARRTVDALLSKTVG